MAALTASLLACRASTLKFVAVQSVLMIEDVLKRVSELAKEDKIPVIIDLLYGLPYQTKEILEQDLNDFMSTGAHGLDLYQLVVGGTAPMLNLVEKARSHHQRRRQRKRACMS